MKDDPHDTGKRTNLFSKKKLSQRVSPSPRTRARGSALLGAVGTGGTSSAPRLNQGHGWKGTRRARAGAAGRSATTSPFGPVVVGASGNQTMTFVPVRGSRTVRVIATSCDEVSMSRQAPGGT